uniref:Uncharacterized protein n=1 Tax=Picea sitchensis TaxID=3332 RepID=B8LQ44_PICSI|nr:unknown [Picea sitchensis]
MDHLPDSKSQTANISPGRICPAPRLRRVAGTEISLLPAKVRAFNGTERIRA